MDRFTPAEAWSRTNDMVLERKLVLDDNDVYCPVRATLA
jgi:hypothetical protein